MSKPRPRRLRRATILLLVVSLLALLFVIVTGFLSLARVDRGMVIDSNRADLTDAISDEINAWAISLIKEQVLDDKGLILGGKNPQSFSTEDIFGYRRSSYLAALEPVWDPTWTSSSLGWSRSWTVLEQLRWPAVTSLDDSVSMPQSFAIWQLMRDYDPTQDSFGASPLGGDRYENVRWNVRNPFMDADGDGVPDSHFLLCAPAIEAANNMARTSVRLPRFVSNDWTDVSSFVPYYIPPDDSGAAEGFRGEQWRRYDQQARYEIAMRIISHGGMVTLDSPTLYDDGGAAYTPFNRDFTINLFDATRSGAPNNWAGRPMSRQYQNLNDQNRLFDALSASVAVIEPSLRHRFILPGPAGEDNHRPASRSVPVLAELFGELRGWDGFPSTFLPRFAVLVPLGGRSGQRINLAVDAAPNDERLGWARAVSRNPTEYNMGAAEGTYGMLTVPYARRHSITTVNYSDDLARKQTAGDPQPTPARQLDLNTPGGATYHGELKFYLGEVAKAFIEVDATGSPSSGTGIYAYHVPRGNVIVEELARRYYEMLAGHSGTADDWDSVTQPAQSAKEGVSRRQQAFMLAVNTLAFVAPRDTALDTLGRIPLVTYSDVDVGTSLPWYDNPRGNGAGANGLRYIGYSPQPFFTEAIAYLENYDSDDPDDDPNDLNIAVAVELYNPSDPWYDGATDPFGFVDAFALQTGQFAVALNQKNPNTDVLGTDWQVLSEGLGFRKRFNGRSFMHFVINSEADQNNHFDPLVLSGLSPQISLEVDDPDTDEPFALTLWRKDWRHDASGNPVEVWFPIDEIVIDQNGNLPPDDSWKSAYRDTTPAFYFGAPDFDGDATIGYNEYARWNVATRTRTASPQPPGASGAPFTTTIGNPGWLQNGGTTGLRVSPDPLDPQGGYIGFYAPWSPTTPLITMNAGPINTGAETSFHQQFNNLPMFGNSADLRPRSFPTVGFLLFVARFSHVQKLSVGAQNSVIPLSETLDKQWQNQGYTTSGAGGELLPTDFPADFGHMPIFDNTQAVPSASYFDNTNGVGEVPWGLLVFDYFTTLNPLQDVNQDSQPDVDPLRVPGRININTAPWYVLSMLPLMGPRSTDGFLPIIPGGTTPLAAYPSPSFWHPTVAVLSGVVDPGLPTEQHRLLGTDPGPPSEEYGHAGGDVPWPMPGADFDLGRYRLGPWLAQSAAAYRDGVQYLPDPLTSSYPFAAYADSHLRGGLRAIYGVEGTVLSVPYRPYQPKPIYGRYGGIRGVPQSGKARPEQFGFVTVGELLNVKGFDSSRHNELPPLAGSTATMTALGRGDFVKAVSLMALLDSQYLTTRSNTFTVYSSVMDRENPEASVRSQVTVDRSNLLPRLTYAFYDPTGPTYYNLSNLSDPAIATLPVVPALLDMEDAAGNPTPDGTPETPVRTTNDGDEPRVIASERVGYFNTHYDD